jgi:outer membrane protein assembly factor BamB
LILASLLVASTVVPFPAGPGGEDWPGWRGPDGNGIAPGSPPVEWSEQKNVRWKAALPGKGNSSPVVFGKWVFVTSAVGTGKQKPVEVNAPEGGEDPRGEPRGERRRGEGEGEERPDRPEGQDGPDGGRRGRGGRGGPGGMGRGAPIEEQEFVVLALDRASGKTLWEKKVATAMPHQGTHGDGSYASPTPVTDGEHLIVSFGSYGLYAFTMAGEQVWQKDLGDLDIMNSFGEGSSPVLRGDTLILDWDHEGESFLVALDKRSGAERWRRPRPSGTNWSTPLVVEAGGKTQVIVSSGKTSAYDLASGEELWSCGSTEGSGVISSPVVFDGVALVSTGRRGALTAIDLSQAQGNVSESAAVLWTVNADLPHVSSPLVHDGVVYMLKQNSGLVTALELATGERLYGPERMQALADAYASPIVAGDKLYFAGRDGTVEILGTGPEFRSLGSNTLEDAFDASPAVAGDELYLRGRTQLYCIAAP